MQDQLAARRERYFALSSALAQLDNEQLQARFTEQEAEPGWGRNHTITVEQTQVFVKRIPVTDLEYANQFATRNLYNLPLYYNYGVGSAGFGFFRELVTHIKTTNWVLAGAIENFPLLYHYRIIPATGQHGGVNQAEHQGYVAYWNHSEAVSKFILDRVNASHEAILLLEHFPYTLDAWLLEHPEQLEEMVSAMRAALSFLREKEIIHFDVHWDNILTDGVRPYLSDFGLTLDSRFALSPAEAQFFAQHRYYDDGGLLSGIGYHVISVYHRLPADQKRRILQQYGLAEDLKYWELRPTLLANSAALAAAELLPLTQDFVDNIVKYRAIIELMHGFFGDMRRNHQKDIKFDHDQLVQLLHQTGFLTDHTATR